MKAVAAQSTGVSSSRRRWPWLLVFVPLVLIAFGVGFSSRLVSHQLDEAIARADRLDPHWRLADIEADRQPFPPQGQNGIDQLIAIHIAKPRNYGNWSFPKFEGKPEKLAAIREAMERSLAGNRQMPEVLNEEQLRVLRLELERASEAVRQARGLVNFPRGRYPIVYAKNVVSTPLDHAQNARYSVLLLRDDALLRAHSRDISGALLDFKAIVHLNRGLGDEPMLITMLIAMSIDQRAVLVLERTLGLGEATEKELLEIETYLLEQAQVPYFLIGCRGERAGIDSSLERVQSGELSVNEFATLGGTSWLGGAQEWLNRTYASLTIKQHRAEALNLLTDAVELGKQPMENQQAGFLLWDRKIKQMKGWRLAHLLLPPLSKIADADIRNKASLRSAAVGVACERFRLAKGRWPKALEELVPQFLDQLPIDPFDGQPLKMKYSDGTFVVYSVGIDRVDNGGQLDLPSSQPGSDTGFRLFDLDKRRQPARPFVFETNDP